MKKQIQPLNVSFRQYFRNGTRFAPQVAVNLMFNKNKLHYVKR